MVKVLVLVCVLAFLLGFAMPPDYIAVGLLFFALGYCAHFVLAIAWRAHRVKARAPRRGDLVYIHRPHGPQAVRKERRA